MSLEPADRHCRFDFAEALEFDPALDELMQRERIARIRMPYGESAWLVTGYDDVRTVTSDRRFSRSAVAGRDFPRMTSEPIVQDDAINLVDPPAGTRLRSLVAQAFTPERMEELRPRTEQIVDDLLDRMEQSGRPADLMKYLADPLPLTSICEFLRIPEADRDWLRAHARTMMDTRPERHDDAVVAKRELRAYFADLAAERSARPGDDLVSVLALARDGSDALSRDELTVMAMVLLITGQDTTTYQIGNISSILLSRPDLAATLRERPESMELALQEILRFVPFRKGVGIPRVALQDVELGGVTIRAGEFVHVSYLTANRDPRKFPEPDRIDITRSGPQHMTFGWGSHHCLGAPLALLELRTAFTRLLERFPGLELAAPAQTVEWNASSIWRYPTALPVSW